MSDRRVVGVSDRRVVGVSGWKCALKALFLFCVHSLLDFMKEHHLSEEREHIYFNSGVKCWCERVSKDIENKVSSMPAYCTSVAAIFPLIREWMFQSMLFT